MIVYWAKYLKCWMYLDQTWYRVEGDFFFQGHWANMWLQGVIALNFMRVPCQEKNIFFLQIMLLTAQNYIFKPIPGFFQNFTY